MRCVTFEVHTTVCGTVRFGAKVSKKPLPLSSRQNNFVLNTEASFSTVHKSDSLLSAANHTNTRMAFQTVRYNVTFNLQPALKAEREYTYNSTLSLTSAADGGRCLTPRRGRFIPGKDAAPTAHENGLAQGRSGLVKKIFHTSEFDLRTSQRGANHYSDCAFLTAVMLDVTRYKFNPKFANRQWAICTDQ